jgi:hypothetical protein
MDWMGGGACDGSLFLYIILNNFLFLRAVDQRIQKPGVGKIDLGRIAREVLTETRPMRGLQGGQFG